MQGFTLKNGVMKRFLAAFLTVSVVCGVSVPKSKAIALETAWAIVNWGTLIYSAVSLGLDVWDLYKDVTSADDVLEREGGFVSDLESTTVASPVASTMLYNGVELPNIDTVWSKGAYPYAIIAKYDSFYYLYFLSGKLYRAFQNHLYSIDSSVDYIVHDLEDSIWGIGSPDSETQGPVVSGSYTLIWANFDVLASDKSTVAFAASAPVFSGDSSADSGLSDTADSRTSSLMQAIHTYNTNNSYVDNSTNVNFFLVPSGEDPTEDTVVSPVIYDEETLVYTDPVTGTQYLTNGWTYDYLTRCYTLDMADESYKIGETVIDTIKLTYGDELLTVDHYSGGSLIQSDKYNYVMMSGSACAIDGHTYNVETTKEPTCTAAGERTYTCSVCGNQYVEEITKTDHAYANYEIEQEATCTAPGIASYTCTTCGGQYTDTLPALGHDWQPTAATEESYVMPDNVHCPDCYGSDFTYTRSDYEILTGKNLFNFPERSFIYTGEVDSKNFRQFDSNSAYVGLSSNNYFNNSKIYSFEYDSDLCSFDVSAAGGYGVGFPFALTPGKQYSLSAVVTSDSLVCISFYDSEGKILSWSGTNYINATFTVPDDAYWTVLVFRDCNDSNGISASYSQVQLEKGSEITEYEPYTTKEIEIIPPIYTFTCFDCSTVWTKEAEYQGATVTYTCTRCHETRTEASGEESGLFHSIGNLIADGITWATDKLTQLVENLSGINKTFNDYANSIRENTGQFPAFLGAILALMPEDFMNVIWLGVVALVALAVWKKWFS